MSTVNYYECGHLGGCMRADAEHPHGDPGCYFPELWQWLMDKFRRPDKPFGVVDVGCGEGHALEWFYNHGAAILGLEGCEEAIRYSPVEDYIRQIDFTQGSVTDWPSWSWLQATGADLIWCCEVVEHIEERFIPNYLPAFKLGRVLAMTHGFPGQEGYHHVNLQPVTYWVKLLAQEGFELDEALTAESRKLDKDGHWQRSGLIFHNRG